MNRPSPDRALAAAKMPLSQDDSSNRANDPHGLPESADPIAEPRVAAGRSARSNGTKPSRPRRRQAKQAMLSSILPTMRPGTKSAKRRYKGPVNRASLLDPHAIKIVEDFIASKSRSPESDLLKFRLSVRGGLRAGEIADLPITAMLDSTGRIADEMQVYASKTKKTRPLAVHPEIRLALENLRRRYPQATHAAFSMGAHGQFRRQSAAVVTNWFHRLYRSAGLKGASSHSGRRTFATDVARLLGHHGASLKDLQNALGHACLSSTECYLEPSDQFGNLVRRLGY